MTLLEFSNNTASLSLNQLLEKDDSGNLLNRHIVREIQTILNRLGLLDPQVERFGPDGYRPRFEQDGIFGSESKVALRVFCKMTDIVLEQSLTPAMGRAILTPDSSLFPALQLIADATDPADLAFAKRILRHMISKGYWIARHPDMFNIIYVEDAAANGMPLPNTDNAWNDRRILIKILPDGTPKIVLNVPATTEPRKAYAERLLENQKLKNHPDPALAQKYNKNLPIAAARIAFGQYKAWEMGLHRSGQSGEQPALHQEMPVLVFRDKDASGTRDEDIDEIMEGVYGINQHSTKPGFNSDQVGAWSEGCLVGRNFSEHLHFLELLKSDPRYVHNPRYRFMTAVLNGDHVATV